MNTQNKTLLFVDMDNVLVDFGSGLAKVPVEERAKYEKRVQNKNGYFEVTDSEYDCIPGIFSLMEPVSGAIESIRKLNEKYDIYILSTSPWKNPSAWSDKLIWVQKYFGDVFYKRLILSHHKDLCHREGAYLIDDRTKNGADAFGNHLIQFGTERFPDWNSVVEFLMGK